MADTATLDLLGGFAFLINGGNMSLPSKSIEILAFLSLQPERRASRERLSGILWPDLPQERALGNLSTTVWRMRRAIKKVTGYELIKTTRTSILLETSR